MAERGDLAWRLACLALELEAFKFSPEQPFTWASGFRMPVYNDNRLLLSRAAGRALVAEALAGIVDREGLRPEVVVGVATSGIPHATSLADRLGLPLAYVRDKPKEHGLRNRIEGISADEGLGGRRCVVVEDLISTGGSSARAVEAVREAGGKAPACVAIFSYGFPEGRQPFDAMSPACKLFSVLELPLLLEAARVKGKLSPAQSRELEAWQAAPWAWGAERGFPKIEKEKR